jgi:CRISPR-associated protein (TIGR03986 family)
MHNAYLFEAKGIQRWIMEGGRLRDITAASNLLARCCRSDCDDLLKPILQRAGLAGQFSRRAGGAFVLHYDDGEEDRFDRFRALWRLVFMQTLPGLEFVEAWGRGSTAEAARADAYQSQTQRRSVAGRENGTAALLPYGHPLTRFSPRTGRPAVPSHDSEGMIDAVTQAKRRHARAGETVGLKFVAEQDAAIWQWPNQMDDEANATGSGVSFPFTGEDRWIAVMHADISALGRFYDAVGAAAAHSSNPISMAHKAAKHIEDAVIAAARHATASILTPAARNRTMPARPIVLGGDDVTIILRGDVALPFTAAFLARLEVESLQRLQAFTKKFKIANKAAQGPLTAAAGVAFGKAKQPFFRLLDLAVTAKTPLLVGAERQPLQGGGSQVRFWQLPDGTKAIPGASLRGLIRSVVEIAGFGRATFIDERRYGLRDLYNREFYTRRMTSGNGHGEPIRYRMKAGWLRGGRGSAAEITPCEWAKVHVSDLISISGTTPARWEPRQSAPERYRVWGASPLGQTLLVDDVEQDYTHTAGTICYRRAGSMAGGATGTAPTTRRTGTIVLTGKPAAGSLTQPRKKKYEFFFYDSTPARSPVSATHLWKDFELIHEEQLGAAGGTGNRAWPDYWKPRFRAGNPVPVFYIEEGGRITSFGLASMFRMAHELTTHDLLANASPDHLKPGVEDFAHLLFGRAADRETASGAAGRRGRVAFEPARLTKTMPEIDATDAILASPRPQFYPAYVKQVADGGATQTAAYASYGSLPQNRAPHRRRPELAGRKRYPVRAWPPASFGTGEAQMTTQLHPLAAGSAFAGRVRFHNLKPAELGALVWALRLWAPCWGQRSDLRHALGMGKPYGFGAAEIAITGARIEANTPKPDGARNLLADGTGAPAVAVALAYADAFVDHMEAAWKAAAKGNHNSSWTTSEQIEMLLGLAQPPAGDQGELRYLTLPEFREVKKRSQVLPPAARRASARAQAGTLTDDQSFPRNAPARTDQAPPPQAAPADQFPPGTRVSVLDNAIDATVLARADDTHVCIRDDNGDAYPINVVGLRLVANNRGRNRAPGRRR